MLTSQTTRSCPLRRCSEKIFIEKPGNPLAARGNRDDDAINIDKRLARRLEPHEVRIHVGSGLFECDQERSCAAVYTPRVESYTKQCFKASVIKRGCFFGICVVQ